MITITLTFFPESPGGLGTSGIASLSLFLVTVWQQSWLCECMVGVCSVQIINFEVKSGCQSTGLFGPSVSCQISRWRCVPFLFFCNPLNLLVICSLFSTVLGWNSLTISCSFCWLLLPLFCFQGSFARVSTRWEENLTLTREVLGIQSSDSLQRILGLDLCELALSVCPLTGHNGWCSCWGCSRVLLHVRV